MNAPTSLRARGLQLLRQALGEKADFREGQWEAIEALVQRRDRLLVVQRTGWGKSIVYFLSTRLLRDQGAGPTLLVSPLLALMRNQIEAARRIGIRAETINSSNPDEWSGIERQILANAVDVLLISPERFANEEFRDKVLIPLSQRVGLLAIDEAHCISDWGHDFRPDYRRIVRVLQALPQGVPVIGTTATANNRVVADILGQLGSGLEICRGPLVRQSLQLQNLSLPEEATKMAWVAHHLANLPGSGIIYTLTIRSALRLAAWLRSRRFEAMAYTGRTNDQLKLELEDRLLRNDIKVIVATSALGMGFDKPDLGFVIHFQQPGSVVHYYQQVGRAGRAISQAFGILLSSDEDREVVDYFIENAFPPEKHLSAILDALERAENGLSNSELEQAVNLPWRQIKIVLTALAVDTPAAVVWRERRWYIAPVRYDLVMRKRKVAQITSIRRDEQAGMDVYRRHTGCLMAFLSRELDDPNPADCGKCANCVGRPLIPPSCPAEIVREASLFLRSQLLTIQPKCEWPYRSMKTRGWYGKIPSGLQAEAGRALSIYNDPGYGILVQRGKYQDNRFADCLIDALLELLNRWQPRPNPVWVTCVPSLDHPELVPQLASRLAQRLGLPFRGVVRKIRRTQPQKQMENDWQQAHNLDGVFAVDHGEDLGGPVLLVDDLTDSGWTFTILAALLRQAGSGPVFPLALAANR